MALKLPGDMLRDTPVFPKVSLCSMLLPLAGESFASENVADVLLTPSDSTLPLTSHGL